MTIDPSSPTYKYLRHLLTDQDITDIALSSLIANSVRESENKAILKELKKMNAYLAVICDHRIDEQEVDT